MDQRAKVIRYSMVLIAALALISGGLALYHRTQPYHLLTVTPGKLYRSGTLKPQHLEKVLDHFQIKTVVSLRTEGENAQGSWYAAEREICRRKGVDLRELPIDEPPSEEQVTQWLDLLAQEDRAPILVHCKHGSVRTGIMVAIYQMEYLRQDNEKTLSELPLFGHDMSDPVRLPLREFLLNYIPSWKKEPSSRKFHLPGDEGGK